MTTAQQAHLVLIVDDDEGIRETLRFMLEDSGYRTVEAVHGGQALEMLRASEERMVILLDLKMPVLDGEDLLEAVAEGSQTLQRHAYVVDTASPQAVTPRLLELIDQLAIPFVPKPFSVDDLLEVVAQAALRLQ